MNRRATIGAVALATVVAVVTATSAPVQASPASPAGTATTTTSTTTTAPATSTTSSSSSSTATTSTTAAPADPGSADPSGRPGVYIAETPDIPAVQDAPSGRPVFIAASTSGATEIELDSAGALSTAVDDPSEALQLAVEQFFARGGTTAYVWPAAGESAGALVAAIEQLSQRGSSADLFVVPALASLTGDDYLRVADSLTDLAQAQVGVALLDAPSSTVAEVSAAWPDVSALVTLAEQLRGALSSPGAAALYSTPLTERGTGDSVPASAVVAGLIAGNDADRGVWSSSAGVSSAVNDLTVPLAIGNPQLGQLDPVGVNSFRTVSNYGTVLWGDRTLAADDAGAERYLSVRRTADWIQRSLSNGLTWTARAANDQATWTSATAAVSAFLTDIWQAGALFGDDAEQAFRVTVDAATPAAMGVQVEAALVEPDEFLRITLTAPTLSG